MARTVLGSGVDADGGIWNELHVPGGSAKDWWPQAEGVVGFLNAFELSRDPVFLDAAMRSWSFIRHHVIDRELGEWHWRVLDDGRVDRTLPKISEWKCPYHNGRMCIEAGRRLLRLGAAT
jgi:mannobiose 2-epimerase